VGAEEEISQIPPENCSGGGACPTPEIKTENHYQE
jgi:hypothetical protein